MKPLILDYSIDRVGEYNPIFEYDSLLSLNVVHTNDGKIPFMDLQNEDLLLITRTKVIGESDDDGISLLELQTKTRVIQESDDDANYLLELTTKTLVRQESDD
jgi:hypothetical protein